MSDRFVRVPSGYRYSLVIEGQEVSAQYLEGKRRRNVFGRRGVDHGGTESAEPFWLSAAPSPPEGDGLVEALLALRDRYKSRKIHINDPSHSLSLIDQFVGELDSILTTHGHGGGEGR